MLAVFLSLGMAGASATAEPWAVKLEYPNYTAYAGETQARVVLKDDNRPNANAYLRLMCQRALSLPYAEKLKAKLGAALGLTIGPEIHYAEGAVEGYQYRVEGNSADCSGQFVETDARSDMLQLTMRVLWTRSETIDEATIDSLVEQLVGADLTREDAIAFVASRAPEFELLTLVDEAVDWEAVTLDLSRVRVAERLWESGYFGRARMVLDTCKGGALCARASSVLSSLPGS